MSEDGESSPPEDKVEIWQGSGPSVPQHPSPPPPAPSDNSSIPPKAPAQKVPVVSSSELIVEEPLEPTLLSSNNGSSSDTPHTSDSTSSSITTTVSPTNVTMADESNKRNHGSLKGRQQMTVAPFDSSSEIATDEESHDARHSGKIYKFGVVSSRKMKLRSRSRNE